MANQQLCMVQRIQAFPNLRMFKDDTVQPPDYRNDRTVDAMMEFVKTRLGTPLPSFPPFHSLSYSNPLYPPSPHFTLIIPAPLRPNRTHHRCTKLFPTLTIPALALSLALSLYLP